MKVYIEVDGHGQYWVYRKDNHHIVLGPFDSIYGAYDNCGDAEYDVVER